MQLFQNAQCIWNQNAVGENTYADFFAVFGKADHIRIACDGNYALWLNGEFVNCGSYPGYEDLAFCDWIDLSAHAKDAGNQLRITAHHPGLDTSTYRNKPPFVIFEVYDGETVVAASGRETLSRRNPNYAQGTDVGMVSGQLGFTFGYDAQAPEEPCTPSVLAEPPEAMEPRPTEKLRIDPLKPSAVMNIGVFTDRQTDGTAAQIMQAAALENRWLCGATRLPDDAGMALTADSGDGIYAVIDLGEEDTGLLSIDLEVPHACDILIGWGEHLADLRVRTYVGSRNFAARYRAKAGRNRFENPLLRCGLRFVQLHIYAQSCRIFYAGIRPTRYPLPKAEPCPMNDGLHRSIYDVCVRTLDLCMHEHYEDCPWREQALYTMDSRNQMLCGYDVWHETAFCKASLRLIAHSLREDGLLELCSPARVPITIPSFSAIFIVQLNEYLTHSGDVKTVEALLPAAEAIAKQFETRMENGLLRWFEDQKYWNFYEWQEGLDDSRKNGQPRSFDAPLCAFVSMAFQALAEIQHRLNRESSHAEMLSETINSAVQCFWDEDAGAYASYLTETGRTHFCELTNALMLCCGAVLAERKERVQQALMSGTLIPVTLSHSIFKYDALLENRVNIPYVLNDIAEKWGHMLMNGATTFWETIDGESAFGNAGSLCHGWSAIPAYVYFKIARGNA